MSAATLRSELKDTAGYDARVTVLGYIQRGAAQRPLTPFSPLMGAFAVESLLDGKKGMMVGTVAHQMSLCSLSDSWQVNKILSPEKLELVEKLSI